MQSTILLKPVCIILAAGASSRFKSDKLAQRLAGKTLLRRAVEAVPRHLFERVILVTARPEGEALAKELGLCLVRNDCPQDGVSRSIRLGLEQAGECSGALFLVADQPLLRPSTLEQIVAEHCAHPEGIICAAHSGKRGNPCLFPAALFPQLLALEGDTGGSAVIRAKAHLVHLVEAQAQELLDVDTPEQLNSLISKIND